MQLQDDLDESPRWRASTKLWIALGVAGILCVLIIGLSWYNSQIRLLLANDLRQFALRYHEYHAEKGESPSSLRVLESFTAEKRSGNKSPAPSGCPLTFERIQDGRFIMIWSAVLSPNSAENDKYILGYEANATEHGGFVMFAGGSVRELSPQQIQGLPRVERQPPTSRRQ